MSNTGCVSTLHLYKAFVNFLLTIDFVLLTIYLCILCIYSQKHEPLSARTAVYFILSVYSIMLLFFFFLRGFNRSRGNGKYGLKVRWLRVILRLGNTHAAGMTARDYDITFKHW